MVNRQKILQKKRLTTSKKGKKECRGNGTNKLCSCFAILRNNLKNRFDILTTVNITGDSSQ